MVAHNLARTEHVLVAPARYNNGGKLRLMGGTEEVEDDLDGVEGLQGDLNEEGVPVGHGAVPEAGELEGAQGAALVALGADEAGFLVDVAEQVELFALVVTQAADKVDGVEVSGPREDVGAAGG